MAYCKYFYNVGVYVPDLFSIAIKKEMFTFIECIAPSVEMAVTAPFVLPSVGTIYHAYGFMYWTILVSGISLSQSCWVIFYCAFGFSLLVFLLGIFKCVFFWDIGFYCSLFDVPLPRFLVLGQCWPQMMYSKEFFLFFSFFLFKKKT